MEAGWCEALAMDSSSSSTDRAVLSMPDITYYPDLAFPGAADTVGAFADLAVANDAKRLVLLSGRGEEAARQAEV